MQIINLKLLFTLDYYIPDKNEEKYTRPVTRNFQSHALKLRIVSRKAKLDRKSREDNPSSTRCTKSYEFTLRAEIPENYVCKKKKVSKGECNNKLPSLTFILAQNQFFPTFARCNHPRI